MARTRYLCLPLPSARQAQKLDQRIALAVEAEAAAGHQSADAAKKNATLEGKVRELQTQLTSKEEMIHALKDEKGSLREAMGKANSTAQRAQSEVRGPFLPKNGVVA